METFDFELDNGGARIILPTQLTELDLKRVQLRVDLLKEEAKLKERAEGLWLEIRTLLNKALDDLIWCSGSPDFAPEGQAREGWVKGPQETIERLTALLRKLGETEPSEEPETNSSK
jgi:hypothetical protein